MEITPGLIKELRILTGIGMMDCKEALTSSNGDISKAIELLRQKGMNINKPTHSTSEGLVGSYIHTGGKVGVLLELQCESDFVARGEHFKSLLHELGMQVAACPSVEYVSVNDIPQALIDKEKEIEMGRNDLSNKPPQVREKIVQGRIAKHLKELSLLDQPFIKDSNISVEEHIKLKSQLVGESIHVKRFTRYILGEES